MELRPGILIAGRFRVERKVGSGGMGEVWSGEQTALGVRVALKTLLPAAACDPQIVARFKREAYPSAASAATTSRASSTSSPILAPASSW